MGALEVRTDDSRARVAIVGPGAIGGFYGAQLAAAGHDVVFCARRPFDEIVVTSPIAPVSTAAHVVVSADELADDGPRPWVLVGVKAHQTESAAPWLERLCDDRAVVLALQNGVESVERLTPFVRGATVVPAVVYCGAELEAPGWVRHSANTQLIVPEGSAGRSIEALFAGSPIELTVTEDFTTHLWRKLAVNVAANGITALTGRPLGVLARDDVSSVSRALLEECRYVGLAEGARLGPDEVSSIMAGLRTPAAADVAPSMLQDRRRGRPTEHDALYGAVVRAGRRHGIPTPINAMVDALLGAGDPDDRGGVSRR